MNNLPCSNYRTPHRRFFPIYIWRKHIPWRVLCPKSLYNMRNLRYLIYKHENARWYYRCGTAIHPILANNMAQSRIYVDYVVERVDAAVSGESNYKANLCFGHDLNIIPIQNIFGLDNMPLYFSLESNTVDYIAEHWRGYKITPKAANIFLIFYRNKEGKVLVRPQMNERDVEMPIESETPHFYEWEKVKELAYARLAEIDELKKGAF